MLRDVIKSLILTGLGIIFGITAFFIFFVGYGNHDAGFWSVLSGILSAVCFHLHWERGKETLNVWHNSRTLCILHIFGFLTAVAGIAAFIWYLFITFYYHIPIQPIAASTVIPAVWSMISGKWGIYLMIYSDKYVIIVQEGSSPILRDSSA